MTGYEGKEVIVFAANYIYSGTLVRVTHDAVVLLEPSIVYETGEWKAPVWKDVQALGCKTIRVRTQAIEAYGKMK